MVPNLLHTHEKDSLMSVYTVESTESEQQFKECKKSTWCTDLFNKLISCRLINPLYSDNMIMHLDFNWLIWYRGSKKWENLLIHVSNQLKQISIRYIVNNLAWYLFLIQYHCQCNIRQWSLSSDMDKIK